MPSRKSPVQRQFLVIGRMGGVDQIAETRRGRLPGKPAEHRHVVDQVQIVLLEPRPEDRVGQVAAGDSGDRIRFDAEP